MTRSSSSMAVPVRGREHCARVELPNDDALLDPSPAHGQWRAAVAAELGRPRVIFAGRERHLVLEHGHEHAPSEPNPSEPTPSESNPSEPTPSEPDRASPWPEDLGEVYTPRGLGELIDRENRVSFDLLVQQVRSPMSIVPFVGAGMSVSFGFPSWSKFLTDAAPLHPEPRVVLARIERDDPIGAATILFEESPERFQRLVVSYFGREVSPDETRGSAVGLLPMIASGPVITTNFDCVLEAAFGASGSPFVRVVTGQEPDHVIRAMHRNERVLIKLHGNATDRSARVFTGLEYDTQYGPEGISKLARIMFTNRPLLFLGCSLGEDRTLDVLEELHEELPGVSHYGVLATPLRVAASSERRRQLDRLGVSPLWFFPGEFGRVHEILQELLQEASTRLLWRAERRPGTTAVRGAVRGAVRVTTRSRKRASARPEPRRPEPGHGREEPQGRPPEPRRPEPGERGEPALGREGPQGRPPEPAALGEQLELITQRLARRLAIGRLTFFLGSGVHLGRSMTARTFYRSLAKDYGFEEVDGRRSDVAQYIVDLESKAEAWAVARAKLQAHTAEPSAVIRFLAELPSRLAQAPGGVAPRLWFLTTNYDTLLEEALASRGEPFHLLYFQADGEWEGRFVYRDLEGTIRILERPQNIHALDEAGHVVVKLDGGIPWDDRMPESVTFAPLEFSISAGRLPAAFPRVLQHTVLEQSLLVLGASLQEPHVQRIVRWSARGRHAVKTWAVKNDVTPSAEKYWLATGVELLNCDLGDFAELLGAQLAKVLGRPEG